MKYEDLLKRARNQLPESVTIAERFEIPKVKGHLEGNKTIISNFNQIAQTLRREPAHLLKYLLKELATPGVLKGQLLILGAKTSASRINEKIENYGREFVLCSECGKPDTKLIKEGNVQFLHCTACGGKHPIKKKL